MAGYDTNATIACCGGKLLKISHQGKATNCKMAVNVFIPPQASESNKVPTLFYLSGLTCTPDNCTEKGFFQKKAAEKGVALVWPDTSPRGLEIPGEDDAFDFGSAAGFYVDALKEPWTKGYHMYTYVSDELPKFIFGNFPQLDENRKSITGHSMGGHGAMMIYLRNPSQWKSCSAFAPIANPINCQWGEKAFGGYLGEENKDKWASYDSTELIKKYKGEPVILIDCGTGDNFYEKGQLLPENFMAAAKQAGNDANIRLRMQPGYDHSYFFMASFADEHVEFHAKFLSA